ncbi:hypothetical protein SLE2022_005230 [Rubroshorea leprosula]
MEWSSILGKCFDYPVGYIKEHSDYVLSYESNIDNLLKQVRNLTNARERVQHDVDAAFRNAEEIQSHVSKWLDDVDDIIEKVKHLLPDEDIPKNKCFFGWCPNPKSRYSLGKKAVREAKTVNELLQQGNGFSRVSYRVIPVEIQAPPPRRSYRAFESRMLTLNAIMNALTDATVEIVGVYGVPGVGKSTLVKDVARKAKEEKFNAVVMAVVAGMPELRKIQGQIADYLGLKFDNETEAGRASRLRLRVKKEERILVILDDIQTTFDLEEVGIPVGDDHRGCKVVLTSRNISILNQMDAQKNFEVKTLPEDEAWDLFKQMAGEALESPNLQSVAADLCRQCGGLPIAIVNVARAMRNKDPSEWENALTELKSPSPGRRLDASSAVEFSYNRLGSDELKSAFLLCGLMPPDASVLDLLKYGMGLGLFRGTSTLEEARQRWNALLDSLKSFCLLLDSHISTGDFTMHDIVRNVAASIASRDQHVLSVRNQDGVRGWPDAGTLRKCTGISLFTDDLIKLPPDLEYPKLKFFQIYNKDPSLKVPDNFFERKRALEVLDWIGMQFLSLPSSCSLLGNLRTLSLESCMLRDVAMPFIRELKQLEILSLYKSVIEQLPEEIGQLARLKLLNLLDCSKLKVIPKDVISNLGQLEELYVGNSFYQWEAETGRQDRQGTGNASLAELKHLPNLTALHLHIPDSQIMPKDLSFEKLKRHKISIGDIWDWSGKKETSTTLKLKLQEDIHLNHGIKQLLVKTEDLYLDELKGVKNVLYELDGQGFQNLKHLHVQNSMEIQYIINSNEVEDVPQTAFPVLESLSLQSLSNLEKISPSQLKVGSFTELRTIKVKGCEKLKNLFSLSIARVLSQLQEIEVADCKRMVEIINKGRGNDDIDDNGARDEVEFSQLHSLTLQYLPELVSFCTEDGLASTSHWMVSNKSFSGEELGTSMALFNQKVMLPNLEKLNLSSIKTTKIWKELSAMAVSIQNLTSITVESCERLKYLLPSSALSSLVQLRQLSISECRVTEEIIFMEEVPREERMDIILFPNLYSLKIKDVQNLTRFCSGNHVEFPSLKLLQIENCPKLETFVHKSLRKDMIKKGEYQIPGGIQPLFDEKVSFPSLESVKISNLKSLKILWNNQLAAGSFSELKDLEVESCDDLRTIFPSNMLRRFLKLETLTLSKCDSVQVVFEFRGLNVEGTYPVGSQLRKLYLLSLPELKHIWKKDSSGILTFYDINIIDVYECGSLKNLFPTSVARGLLELERLVIDSCGLEEIVEQEEGLEANAYHCGETKIFTSKSSIPGEKQILGSLFLVEKVMPNLEEVSLNSDDIEMIRSCHYSANFFSKTKVVQVHCYHNESDSFPFDFLQNFYNLERLEIGCSLFKELFSYGGYEVKLATALSGVKSLKLIALPNVVHVWPQGSNMDSVFPRIEGLEVWECNGLTNLAPSSASFHTLTTLDICKCKGMMNIVTSSTAKSLVQLIKMSIRECSTVMEIVADEEEEEEESKEEIVLSSLKCLELHDLPSLEMFCPGNCNCPCLEDVTVTQCPKFWAFSLGVLSTPNLRKVWLTEAKDQSLWKGDLNATLHFHSYYPELE